MDQVPIPSTNAPRPRIEPLRWIGAYKLIKAVLALVGGLMVLKLMHRDLPEIAQHWMTRLGIDPDSRAGEFLLRKIIAIHTANLRWLALILFAYAPLAVAEGVGLMLRKLWAEWLTLVLTCALIPWELLEFFRKPTSVRLVIFVLNVAVVIYLIVRLRTDGRRRKMGMLAAGGGAPAGSPAMNQKPEAQGREDRQS